MASDSNSFRRFVQDIERDPDEKAALDAARARLRGDDDCPGCGAPDGYPPAGPCDNHATANAVASTGKERAT